MHELEQAAVRVVSNEKVLLSISISHSPFTVIRNKRKQIFKIVSQNNST